jgi:hypothetical protein
MLVARLVTSHVYRVPGMVYRYVPGTFLKYPVFCPRYLVVRNGNGVNSDECKGPVVRKLVITSLSF